MTRDELVKKIQQTQKELQTAGTIHRKDLGRHLRRLQRELRTYDHFKRGGQK